MDLLMMVTSEKVARIPIVLLSPPDTPHGLLVDVLLRAGAFHHPPFGHRSVEELLTFSVAPTPPGRRGRRSR
jgi:hypothetical protein